MNGPRVRSIFQFQNPEIGASKMKVRANDNNNHNNKATIPTINRLSGLATLFTFFVLFSRGSLVMQGVNPTESFLKIVMAALIAAFENARKMAFLAQRNCEYREGS